MKKSIFLTVLLCALTANAQFFVSSGSTVDVSAGVTLYSNEPIFNEGLINLRDASVLEFDNDLTNDGTIDYDAAGEATPGILKIGSGGASFPTTGNPTNSTADQSLNFNVDASNVIDPTFPVDEFIPLIVLDKEGGTATIDRGHVRLTKRMLVTQGTLDAQSSITGTSTNKEVPNTAADRVVARGLTFISPDATTTAVVEESSPGFVNNVIVERFIPGASAPDGSDTDAGNRAFRLFTSSVDLAGTIKDNLQETGQITQFQPGLISNPRPGYGTHITGSTTADPAGTIHGLDVTQTGNPGMYEFKASDQDNILTNGYDAITDSNVGMLNFEAYLLFIRGDRSLDLTNNNTQEGDETILRMLGDLQIGGVNLSNTLDDGIDDIVLLPNVYQAQVDLGETLTNDDGAGTATSGVNTANVAVYDPQLGIHGAWVTVTLPGGSNSVEGGITGTSNANQFLQPNQAVFLTALDGETSTTVVFEENDKKSTDQNTTVDIFSDDTDVKFNVTLFNVDENSYNDNVLVKYGNYNDAVDYSDGPKFWNQFENIAVETGGEFTNLELRNVNGNLDNILLNVTNYSETNYQIQTNYINSQQFQDAYLIDHYLNTQTQLAEGPNYYDFSVDSNIPESMDANRFEIGIDMETLGTDNPDGITELALYPNPATTRVELSLFGIADSIEEIQVVSMDGKLVKTVQVDNLTSYTMDISTLATGVYVVKATTGNSTYTQKLIVE